MVTLRVVFILAIIQSDLVLPMKILQDFSDKHVEKKDGLSYRRFKRQQPCPEGEYNGEKNCCQYCGVGTYVKSECTEPHGESACKECSEGEDFMDKKNGYPECQKCQNCEYASGQEVLLHCTIRQNTVCKCREGFFCSPNENCNQCRHCTECANGIVEPCTSTNDAVCTPPRNHTIVWAIVIPVIFAIIVGVLIYCKRRMKKPSQPVSVPPDNVISPDSVVPFIDPNPTCPPDLQNADLSKHLYEIAGILTRDSVLKLVRKELSPVDMEEIKTNFSSNAREEKYEMLNKWYNVHGRRRALETLLANCTKREAEKIIDSIRAQSTEP